MVENVIFRSQFTFILVIISVIIVPKYGCDALTIDGTCFSHFTSSGVNWENARKKCTSWGYDLASLKNYQEDTLLYGTRSSSSSSGCWFGLNDRSREGTFVWSDGSDSLYINWNANEPNSKGGNEDCGEIWGITNWNDLTCAWNLQCYFCSTKGKNTVKIIGCACICRTEHLQGYRNFSPGIFVPGMDTLGLQH